MLPSREDLMQDNVDTLRKYASSIGVKKVRSYKKVELIEEILRVQNAEEANAEEVEEANNDGENIMRLKYIENADIGTIVAFKIGSKVKSAKIVNRSSTRKKLKLETVYGKQFIVDYKDVLWVKTTGRWPKGVYELFEKKAVNTNGKEE